MEGVLDKEKNVQVDQELEGVQEGSLQRWLDH
jgi:hypothetical protein